MKPGGGVRTSQPSRDELLKLHDQHGKSFGELAKETGLTRNAVQGRIIRARTSRTGGQTYSAMAGATITDPYRADRLLRRFSWESDSHTARGTA